MLAAAWHDLTRAQVQRLIAAGTVQVNGEVVRKSAAVVPGDVVVAMVPQPTTAPEPSPGTLPVLYEDDDVVVIDKPAGIASHGARSERDPTVTGWFAARYPTGLASFLQGRAGIAHRLDKDTSGVMVLGKTPAAQAALGRAFAERATEKTYVAICEGIPPQPRGVVDAPVGRHPGDRTRMAVVRRGRAARTTFEIVAQADDHALVEARPETGRTHQIRVHLAAIGAPVLGDRVYGTAGDGRQLLHAWRLRVPHPSGGLLDLVAPLPGDMRAAAAALGLEEGAVRYCETVPCRRLDENHVPGSEQ